MHTHITHLFTMEGDHKGEKIEKHCKLQNLKPSQTLIPHCLLMFHINDVKHYSA